MLRTGRYTIAAKPKEKVPEAAYYACLHRASDGDDLDGPMRFTVWPIGLRDPLPKVAVPLTDDYPDIVLDLGAVLDQVYDAKRYGRYLAYSGDADPPLSPDDAAWAVALLREKGLRTG